MSDLVLLVGTNLGDKQANVDKVLSKLESFFGTPKYKSHIFETEAWGQKNAPCYYNLAVAFETALLPFDVLHVCKSIEIQMGRTKIYDDLYKTLMSSENFQKMNFSEQTQQQAKVYDNRVIDIDILFYDSIVLDNEILTIPHKSIAERRFVLEPLSEILPDFVHPVFDKTIKELLLECTDELKVKKLETKPVSQCDYFASNNAKHLIYNYITIEGCIGAGKTSLATKIADDFNAKLILEQFADNPFLPKFYKDAEKYAFPLELSFLASRYKQLNDNLINYDLFHVNIVADYFLTKSFIFATKTLPDDMFKLYSTMFNIIRSKMPEPDLLVYLYLNIDNLVKNIKKRGRSYEQDISSEYLNSIQNGYFEYFKQQSNKRILIVDTNNIDFVNNHDDYLKIVDAINQDWSVGIHKLIL
ncbi:MAG: deoxynucleoside kinase [Bacteroidales bacterium]|jgi:deoxyguanosine kinase|nr:deoxynucleoside kinase [Bacteroidales bacterium]MDD2204845.1 deoxynucleoside kinase [Bacteroidales bacterium]MDD3153206.1 deoxynucleoside kinase [Bacteroidales bacterium]MDD3914329.1 deoxynucleoside kinase [Bacteroidales bacterium]MDD4634122.1 deoxynucleoside kinase [Bacteroidales bacterium]